VDALGIDKIPRSCATTPTATEPRLSPSPQQVRVPRRGFVLQQRRADHGAQHDRGPAAHRDQEEIDAKLKTKKVFKDAVIDVLRKALQGEQGRLLRGQQLLRRVGRRGQEAGASNVTTTPDALRAWVDKKSVSMFEDMKVLSKTEVHSRHHIKLEKYAKDIDIEAKSSSSSSTHVRADRRALPERAARVPARPEGILPKHGALKTQTDLLDECPPDRCDAQGRGRTAESLEAADKTEDAEAKALAYCHKVSRTSRAVRNAVDGSRGWFLLKNGLFRIPGDAVPDLTRLTRETPARRNRAGSSFFAEHSATNVDS